MNPVIPTGDPSDPDWLVPEIQTVVLERLKVAAQTAVDAGVLASMRLEHMQDLVYDRLLVRLTAEMQAQRLDDHTETVSRTVGWDVPATWGQHAKQALAGRLQATRWLPGTLGTWLARRWPVRTERLERTVTLKAHWTQYATFPNSAIVTDRRLGHPVLTLLRQPPDVQGDEP